MPQKTSERLGVATRYIGLTRDASLRLAARLGDALVPVGFGGQCDRSSDAVFHVHKVAVIYNMASRPRRDLPEWERLPPNARVIAAERVSGAWPFGWEIPNPFAHS